MDSQKRSKISDKFKPSFGQISKNFNRNLAALRLFGEQIGPLADEADKKRVEEFSELISAGLKRSQKRSKSKVGKKKPTKSKKVTTGNKSEEPVKIEFVFTNDEELKKFTEYFRSPLVGNFTHGLVLRRSVLVSLVSSLDVLISQLLTRFYAQYPESLSGEDRNITLSDLRDLGSVKAAEDQIIDKEIDSVLRGSFQQQLGYFGKRLGVQLEALDSHMDRLVETFQRRNLFVHNDGVINKKYLSIVSDALCDEYKAKESERVDVDEKYIRRAVDRVQLAGVVLTQTCWRKWSKDEVESADDDLNEHIYSAINKERYGVAVNIAEFGKTLQYAKDQTYRHLLLNLAQAYKWSGEEEQMRAIIEGSDWSACSLVYRLGISALNENYAEFWKLAPHAVAAGELDEQSVVEWPIFKRVREQDDYDTRRNELFHSSRKPSLERKLVKNTAKKNTRPRSKTHVKAAKKNKPSAIDK